MNFCSARLRFEPLNEHHWPSFYALHQDTAVMEYIADIEPSAAIKQRFEQRLFCNREHTTHHCWALIGIESVQIIGFIGYWLVDTDSTELGYMLNPDFQGQGLGTEALQQIVAHCSSQTQIKRLTATVTEGNQASRKMLTKLHFKQLPTQSSGFIINNQEVNDWHFELCINAQV